MSIKMMIKAVISQDIENSPFIGIKKLLKQMVKI